MIIKQSNQGTSLLETIIATAIFGIIMVGFISSLSAMSIVEINSQIRADASLLARENIEIGYNLALSDWQTFYETFEGDYHPEINDEGIYTLVSGVEALGGSHSFTRLLRIQKVYRTDVGGLTTEKIGEVDENYISLLSDVRWGEGKPHQTITYQLILTDLSEFKTIIEDL